jgi:hypothetical protein
VLKTAHEGNRGEGEIREGPNLFPWGLSFGLLIMSFHVCRGELMMDLALCNDCHQSVGTPAIWCRY